VALVRAIGRWGLTWLVVNAIVGSAVFGLPAEYVKLLGRASVLAVVLGGVSTFVIIACIAEVASKFPEPGGAYIYARTVFGRFVGIQVGWLSWTVRLTATAAGASLFVSYLAGLIPSIEYGWGRVIVLTLLLGGLTAANYIGVRSGAGLSSLFGVAKVLLLLAVGLYGAWHTGGYGLALPLKEVVSPGVRNWFEAFLLLSFMYGGFETALLPLGEVEDPKRVVPAALGIGLAFSTAIYSLIQIGVLNTRGAQNASRPLAVLASTLFGPIGAVLTSLGALICIYGFLSASVLGAPRLTYALAEKGDFPAFLAKVHPRFKTPYTSVVLFGAGTWAIAVTGSFRIAVALSIGARLVTYGATCAALIPLRRRHPERVGITISFGPFLSIAGIAMTLALVSRMHERETIALVIASAIATMNWWWISRKRPNGTESGGGPVHSGG
jgi:basic amino acid/polyamine antiporter, APA family